MCKQLSIFEVMRRCGGDWINCSGDFTKRISDQGTQVYLSLSPDGDKLTVCCCFPEGLSSTTFDLPLGMNIPRNFSKNFIVDRICSYHSDVNPDSVYEMKNKYGERIAVAILPSAMQFIVFGYEGDKERIVSLVIT